MPGIEEAQTPSEDVVKLVLRHLEEDDSRTPEEIVQLERENNVLLIPKTVEDAMMLARQLLYASASLADVHRVFKKWFHLQDTNRLDVVLATALSQKFEGTPLWLILVAPSGDMKSEQITALDDDGDTTKIIHRFTDKTLVNGHNDKDKHPDLAPVLDNKIMLIPDMAEILTLHPNVKAAVWAQLRDLFDGYAGMQSGMGADISYKDLRVTFLAASTPAIDDQILIHQSLGTRELIYRPTEVVDVNKMMDRVWYNERHEKIMRAETRAACRGFLKGRKIADVSIPPDVSRQIMCLAKYLAVMRASAPTDSYSGELRGFVYPERPTRVLKQLKRLFICLKSLDAEYTDERALEIVQEVVQSSVDTMRQRTLQTLVGEGEKFLSTSEVARRLKIGKKTAKSALYALWNLGLVDYDPEEITNSYGQTVIAKERWRADFENSLVKYVELGRPSPDDKQASLVEVEGDLEES